MVNNRMIRQIISVAAFVIFSAGISFAQYTPGYHSAIDEQNVSRGNAATFNTATEPPLIDDYALDEAQGSISLPIRPEQIMGGPDLWTSPEGMVSTLQIMVILTVLTLSPTIVIMTTSFVRLITVLSILRQAIGTGQLPPSQVITALSLFLTLLIMMPVWSEVYTESILPYSERRISLEEAWEKGEFPIRKFMCMQIERTGNTDDIWLFMRYIRDVPAPRTYEEVPWRALLPAFMLSELKTAFLIGFQIFLPFLILDMVIASVMVSMGMMMLPPTIIALPFKLMLFVLMDGWHLVVQMLLESFEWYV